MKSCESGCGGIVKVFGCKWCPDCYPDFSRGASLNEKAFVVVAGKYEDECENIKFASDFMTLPEAETQLQKVKGYPFARIEYCQGDPNDLPDKQSPLSEQLGLTDQRQPATNISAEALLRAAGNPIIDDALARYDRGDIDYIQALERIAVQLIGEKQ